MAESHDIPMDPLGCVEELRAALADEGLQSPDETTLRRAAGNLAVALGRCRLFGVVPGEELNGTLPSDLALQGSRELARRLEEATQDALHLGVSWDECPEPREADEMVFDLLERNMDFWAGFVALDEAYDAVLGQRQPEREALSQALDEVMDRLEEFDRALRSEMELLSMAAETQLLENWRASLAPEFAEILPWWLDGRLEAMAHKIQHQAEGRDQTPTLDVLSISWWLPPRPVLAAATTAQGPPCAPPLEWRSPDGQLTAELPRPSRPRSDDTFLPLTFRNRDGSQAAGLQGWAVLASVAAEIDSQGQAHFPVGRLRAARQPPELRVGSDPQQATLWELITLLPLE